MKKEKSPNNKNQEENWEKEFDKKFSLSDFWLNPNNYPKNYRDIIAFIEKERKIVEDNTLKHIEEDYQEFIKEIRQEEKEKWLNLTLERIEKIKPPVMKEEYFRELPSLKGMWYAGFSAGKEIILEKLKRINQKRIKGRRKINN